MLIINFLLRIIFTAMGCVYPYVPRLDRGIPKRFFIVNPLKITNSSLIKIELKLKLIFIKCLRWRDQIATRRQEEDRLLSNVKQDLESQL